MSDLRAPCTKLVEDAFAILRAGGWAKIRRVGAQCGLRRADAALCADLAQQALLTIWKACMEGRYAGVENRRPPLWSIVRGDVVDLLRRRVPVLAQPSDEDHDPIANHPDPGPAQDDVTASRQFQEAVKTCLETLTPRELRAWWAHLEFPEPKTAAENLGIPVGTYYVHLHRARRRLEDCLHSKGYANEEGKYGLH